ncbi:MAG TPA: response regulator [Myxococcaceae bacterium]|nr:response regulator [Myxococcaceae bacterium]
MQSRIGSRALNPTNGHPPPSILVVDDDPDILEALSEILESEGFAIRQARNGQEALEILETVSPNLILLDLMMPVMDGWEFAEKMRRRVDWSQIPVIVLSADRNIGGRARELGALGYLAKPFELSALLSLVQSSLSRSQKTKTRGPP